jgi:predicted nucleic acid-binding protein
MKLIVHDACVLIDLIEGSMLDLWPLLGFETITSNLVVHEITDIDQKAALDLFKSKKGITVIDLNPEELMEVAILQQEKARGLTISDCSALYLARERGAILLTSDGMLRKIAERDKIEVRGILWVLDSLVKKRLLASKKASSILIKILQAGSHLPQDECAKRFEAWE